MTVRLSVLLVSMVLMSCMGSTTLKPEFTPVGPLATTPPSPRWVSETQVDEVQLFYASSPPGFTLRENELKVEPGYGHRIVGIVKARTALRGELCTLRQSDAIAALKRGAAEHHATAVVYATTPLSQDGDEAACASAYAEGSFGTGWAVVLGEAPTAPAVGPVMSGSSPASSSSSPASSPPAPSSPSPQ